MNGLDDDPNTQHATDRSRHICVQPAHVPVGTGKGVGRIAGIRSKYDLAVPAQPVTLRAGESCLDAHRGKQADDQQEFHRRAFTTFVFNLPSYFTSRLTGSLLFFNSRIWSRRIAAFSNCRFSAASIISASSSRSTSALR